MKEPHTTQFHTAEAWEKGLSETFRNWVAPYILRNAKPLSKARLAKLKKKRIEYIKKEKNRRAKKITMTVGELEDKLEEASDY
ncbi:MAG: hypothetical protein WC648_01145 [Candidatus Paceibacterota bacterium]|jgi:hypothetical protein